MVIYGYVWVYMGTYVYIWVTILSVPQICLNSKTILKPHRPMVWWLLRLTILSVRLSVTLSESQIQRGFVDRLVYNDPKYCGMFWNDPDCCGMFRNYPEH